MRAPNSLCCNDAPRRSRTPSLLIRRQTPSAAKSGKSRRATEVAHSPLDGIRQEKARSGPERGTIRGTIAALGGLLLAACGGAPTTSANATPPLSPDVIYLRAACPFATIWQFWIDGRPQQAPAVSWVVFDSLTFRFAASP